jgi:hypothetical protein
MRYAINVPNFGDYADPDTFVRLARSAEAADWDGLFVWDHLRWRPAWRQVRPAAKAGTHLSKVPRPRADWHWSASDALEDTGQTDGGQIS